MWLKLTVIALDNGVSEQLINMDKMIAISKCPEGSFIVDCDGDHIRVQQYMSDIARMLSVGNYGPYEWTSD